VGAHLAGGSLHERRVRTTADHPMPC
jgi:hypothetical protein